MQDSLAQSIAVNPTVLLVGNPNAGKTTLFNALTGLRARTANYPGITVDIRTATVDLDDGTPDGMQTIDLVDLPGLYSMETTSPEEDVAARAIRGELNGDPSAVVLVLDATNLVRHLFLADEVLSQGKPTLVVLNLIDAAEASGIKLDCAELSNRLGCPVVGVSARTGTGIGELKDRLARLIDPATAALPIAHASCTQGCTGCEFAARYAWAESVCDEIIDGAAPSDREIRWLDRILTAPITGTLALSAVMLAVFIMIFSLADVPMGMIEDGFGWIGQLVDALVPAELPSRFVWFPAAFGLALALIAGGYRLGRIHWTRVSSAVAVGCATAVGLLPLNDFRSLLIDGVIGGIAGVVVFLPQICILFFFITLLEDSGYLARAAMVMERLMRRVGLPGKAFVPMLSSHACAIPGIMACRTIENWRDRLVTILVLPLLTCSARLPVYAMISALLFAGRPLYAALTFAGAYLLGLTAALITAWCLKHTVLPGETAPLIIELPPYRMPSFRTALLTALDRGSVFVRKAGSVILLISVTLWFLASYPNLPAGQLAGGGTDESYAQQSLEYSYAGRAGRLLEPVFAPLGFDWKINVGVVTSFAAREVLVSTLSVVYGIGEEGAEDPAGLLETLRHQRRPNGIPVFTTATSMSLLVFYVLAMQCLPTQVVTKRETGRWGWAIFQLVYMTLIAYVAALITFQTLSACGLHS